MIRLSVFRTVLFCLCFSCIFSLVFPLGAIGQDKRPISATPVIKVAIQGIIRDFDTQQPIPFATVQIEGTGQSTVANYEGRYRLVVEQGPEYRLKCSHIAYYSERATVATVDSGATQDFGLHAALIELPGTSVFDKGGNAAERIILEAISRKRDILSKLHDYSFDAYTKLVVRDKKKSDSVNILLITETQLTSYWEQPDKYKEVITARKQSKNIDADDNLVTVGQILNFNRNRIEAGEMSIVSPTATDALDFYDYALMDTTYIDSQRVFVLAIEPKNELETLFKGTIHIADSTYDVVAVDVGFSGLRSAFIQNPRYSQRYAQFHNEYWLPVEIRFGADIKLPFPLPGIPSELSFQHVASLYDFKIEQGIPKGTFGEVVLEVAKDADSKDSSIWDTQQSIPLSAIEEDGYRRIDSVESAPKPIGKTLLKALYLAPLIVTTQDQLFHFNRAEGAYLGFGTSLREILPRTSVDWRVGHAFAADYWQYRFGLSSEPWENQTLTVWGEFHDQMKHRPTVLYGDQGNMSIVALWNQADPFDYYRERGFSAGLRTKVFDQTRFSIGYNNLRQRSAGLKEDDSFFEPEHEIRDNPSIADGDLRSLSTSFSFDSRPKMNRKGRLVTLSEPLYTQFSVGMEYTSPELLNSDFDYTRYYASFYRRQRTFGLGVTSFYAYYGASDKPMPSQRYYTLEYAPLDLYQGKGFQTLELTNFAGDRIGVISGRHEFRRALWVKSGLPLIEKIPWWLSVHGGVFWSDFKHQPDPDAIYGQVARKAYSEIGFSLGNLTPFIAPFNFAMGFTWQLSKYETSDLAVSWGIEF